MDLANVAINFAKELRGLAKDATQPEKKREVASQLADALVRPLVLGLFGEFGAGQPSLINCLLRHRACPPEFGLGRRPPTLIRYAETPAIFSIKKDGAKTRLTSRGIAQIAQGRGAAKDGARIIYKARKLGSVFMKTKHDRANARPGEEADDVSAIEIQLPSPVLSQLEIFEFAADEPHPAPPRYSRLPIRRQPDLVAWMTLANGAWKHSEFLTWKSLSFSSSKPALLLVTDNESLTGDSRARLDARLKDSTQSAFAERLLLSLKDAARLLASDEPLPDMEWQATGMPQLELRLSALCANIRRRNLDRARAIFHALDCKKPGNDFPSPLRLPA